MCGPWLIFVPFAGMFAAFLIYDSNWRRPRKTELEGWMHLGLFAGFTSVADITFVGGLGIFGLHLDRFIQRLCTKQILHCLGAVFE